MASSLENAITKQLEQLTVLKTLLEQELHLISSREPETLMQLLKQKDELLCLIESQDEAVEILHNRFETSGKEISDECHDLLQQCKQVLEECKYLTEINARCVEQGQLRLVHLRNTMVELRSRETMTYDKAGKTNVGGSGGGFSV